MRARCPVHPRTTAVWHEPTHFCGCIHRPFAQRALGRGKGLSETRRQPGATRTPREKRGAQRKGDGARNGRAMGRATEDDPTDRRVSAFPSFGHLKRRKSAHSAFGPAGRGGAFGPAGRGGAFGPAGQAGRRPRGPPDGGSHLFGQRPPIRTTVVPYRGSLEDGGDPIAA